MSDRRQGYVPDGLDLDGELHLVEIRPPEATEEGLQYATGRCARGRADALNRHRDGPWEWADVLGDGSHWTHFRGHRVQVDVLFSTCNEWDLNDWKGRDEIRPAGRYVISLARQQCWTGWIGQDPMRALREIPALVERLLAHDAIRWTHPLPAAAQLDGQRVYYDRFPAVVSSTVVLRQGYVMLRPVGADRFPPNMWDVDSDVHDSGLHEDKVTVLSERIHWHRKRCYGDERPLT